MKTFIREEWPMCIMLGFALFLIVLGGLAVADEAQEERKCLAKGYYFVDGNCYKVIIPEDSE